MRGYHVILFVSAHVLIDSRSPKCECNNRMRPIAKFVFQLIFNGKIFHAFRKVIPPLSRFIIKAIKDLGINFWKTIVQPNWKLCYCFILKVLAGFWEFIQLRNLVEINYRGLVINRIFFQLLQPFSAKETRLINPKL